MVVVSQILQRYGPDPSEYNGDAMHNPRSYEELHDEYFKSIHVVASRLQALETDGLCCSVPYPPLPIFRLAFSSPLLLVLLIPSP